MASKPKEKDYGPSDTEKMQASIAAADAAYFQKTYDPLLANLRDKAQKEDTAATLRGRAQADTMQALSPASAAEGYSIAADIDTAANLAMGATGQMLAANVAAKDAKVTQQVGVLGTARGQAADAGDALAGASRLARSQGLAKASAAQDVRLARKRAGFDVGKAFAGQGLSNLSNTGNLFTAKTGYATNASGGLEMTTGTGLLGGFKQGRKVIS